MKLILNNGKSLNILIRSMIGKSILQLTLPIAAYQVKMASYHNKPQPKLSSIQEEADTKMIFHCCHQVEHPLFYLTWYSR